MARPWREGFVLHEAQKRLEGANGIKQSWEREAGKRGERGFASRGSPRAGTWGLKDGMFGRLLAEWGGWDVGIAVRDEAGGK